jgi:hypothetical protein
LAKIKGQRGGQRGKMKVFRQSTLAAVILLAVVGVAAVLGFNIGFAAIAWPGIVVMKAIRARFGIYANNSDTLWPWLVPGLFIDFVGYTFLFYSVASLWKTLMHSSEKEQPALANSQRPTTSDQRRPL